MSTTASPVLSLLQEALSVLTEQHESDHFRLNYAPRNRRGGRSAGVNGVDDPGLVAWYAAALDRAYKAFRAEDWEPPVPEGHKVPVYILAIEKYLDIGARAITNTDTRGSTILLRSLNTELRWSDVREQAEVDATHETAHLFTHRHHPPDPDPMASSWVWFDEATAVATERRLCPRAAETVRFGASWAYQPELPLNEVLENGGGYCAAWFLEYLTGRFGHELVRDAWKVQDAGGPLEALDGLLKGRHATNLGDVYERFAADAYAFQHMAPDVYYRFGERTITEWFDLRLGAEAEGGPDQLLPHACRYYRFDLPAGAQRLDILLRARAGRFGRSLRCRIRLVGGDPGPGAPAGPAQGPSADLQDPDVAWRESLSLTGARATHAILTVANIPAPDGMPGLDGLLVEREAIQEYTLRAEAT
jgi:hypothetical protein